MVSFVVIAFLSVVMTAGMADAVDIYTSQVFISKIHPGVFDWAGNSSSRGFRYRATLAKNPALPSWLSYVYSERHKAGFIFGVPPHNQPSFNIDLVGINKDTYEVRTRSIHLNVTEKQDLEKYEVHMRVHNLNVQDMFDSHRLERLMNIFTQVLWKSSKDLLYVKLLDSAVKLGARVPLRPQEGEGVVIHLGSREEFSEDLVNLQKEIQPLINKFNSSNSSCPRDLKRTSVDRHFRPQGFILDWCYFRLVKLEGESGNAHLKEVAADILGTSRWDLADRYRLPSRDYSSEVLTTLIVPICILVILWVFLSFILCFQHDSVEDPISDDFFETIFEMCEEYGRGKKQEDDICLAQYLAVQRATDTLRSMDSNRNTEPSPRLTNDRMDTCRPNPPPYSATKRLISSDS